MKKFILCALFLLASCISAEERGFRGLVKWIDPHARHMRWVDEDVFMLNGMVLDWPLPPDAESGTCLLLIASPRENEPQARFRMLVTLGIATISHNWESGRYAFMVFKVPDERFWTSVAVTAISGDGHVDLSAFEVNQSACRTFRSRYKW